MQNFNSVEATKPLAQFSSDKKFTESSGENGSRQNEILQSKKIDNTGERDSAEVADEKSSQYPSGLGFVVTCVALCFAVFLVALVMLYASLDTEK